MILLGSAGIAAAQPIPHTAPFGPNGTWNVYQLIQHTISWDDARKEAATLPCPVGDPNLKGHLVTFSCAAENEFMRLVNREEAWCGLTDNESFGGHEAGSKFRDGWKWTNGEPLTFINWIPNQPDEWHGQGPGEDGVFFNSTGRWCDNGMGQSAGQKGWSFYYVAEWETHSPTPVPGAFALSKVWSDQWVMPEYVPGKWNARWVFGYVKFRENNWIEAPLNLVDGNCLLMSPADAAHARTKPLIQDEGKATSTLPWLWFTTEGGNRTGWLTSPQGKTNIPQLPQFYNYTAAVVGKIHVEKAGTYSFAVSAQDAFALRIGGQKWKSASGDGYIDPLDPLTFTQYYGDFGTKAIGVIDLPAGDHVVQGVWMVRTTRSEFNVLSAPGEHVVLGDTADWRPLGHAKKSEKIPWLGISDAGWTIDCSIGDSKDLSLQDGLAKLELDTERITKTGVKAVHFAESAEATHFPNAMPFPNDRPDVIDERWPFRAVGKLVVPQDGTYQIGLHAVGRAALRIKGGVLQRVTQGAQTGKDFHRQADTFDFNGQADLDTESKITTAWELKKGEYDIQVFYVRNMGPPALAVFSSPDGPYPPVLLETGGAKLADDVVGLPHAK